MTFAEIFDAFLVPRENGSEALPQVATWLEKAGRASGADVMLQEFVCRPYVHRLAGVVVLLLASAFVVSVWRKQFAWALGMALLLPAYLLLEIEGYVPLLSGLLPAREQNVVLSFPVADALQTVILGAHYDTKTDLLDHYQRAPIQFLIAPMALLTIAAAISGWRRMRRGAPLRGVQIAAGVLGLYYFALFLALTGGALVPDRSPGALDDGASVALLLRVGDALGSGEVKLERTEVKIVFFAGEEVGAQGSRAFVREHYRTAPPRPTVFVNAEGLGFGPDLRYFTSDRFFLHRYDASSPVVRILDRAYRSVSGKGIQPDPQPVITDARSFMAVGIPSVCVASSRGPDDMVRGLHSARDSVDRIDEPALERTLRFYKAALREFDRTVGS